jgi:hypothetical protein
MKNLFSRVARGTSGDHDDNTHIDDAPKRKSMRALSISLMARLSHKDHSNETRTDSKRSKCSKRRTSTTKNHGEVGVEVSQTPTNSDTFSTEPNSSNQHSRAYSNTSNTSRVSAQTANHNPLQRCQAREISAASSAPTPLGHNLCGGHTSASKSTTHASPNARPFVERDWPVSDRRADPDGFYEYNMARMRRYFELNDATTRYQRRKYLHCLPDYESDNGAKWLAAHPSDLWDTKAEERAASTSTPTAVDKLLEKAEWEDKHGREDMLFDSPEFQAAIDRWAKIVGYFQAWQEIVFRDEWMTGEGGFGQEGSDAPPSPDVGPMGETI